MIFKRVADTWRTISDVRINKSETWRVCDLVYYKVSGVWKIVHSCNYVLFAGGCTERTALTATDTSHRYVIASNSVLPGITLSRESFYSGLVGNRTYGIYSGGESSSATALNFTDKITYANRTRAAGTALGDVTGDWGLSPVGRGGLVGNSTRGLCERRPQWIQFFQLYTLQTYIYATDVVATGGTLTTGVFETSSTIGNASIGVFNNTRTQSVIPFTSCVSKYTYSGNTVVIGATLAIGYSGQASSSTPTYGIFAGGVSNSHLSYPYSSCEYTGTSLQTTQRYTFSTDTFNTGTLLQEAIGMACGSGDSEQGIYYGGIMNRDRIYVMSMQKYIYSSGTTAIGTNLPAYKYGSAATSTSPGGFTN